MELVELVEFLRARLDEDEASDWPHRRSCQMLEPVPAGLPFDTFSCNCDAAWRWLRDVEADRKLIEAYEEARTWYERNKSAPAGELEGLYTALRIRAERFADHPDYNPQWAKT